MEIIIDLWWLWWIVTSVFLGIVHFVVAPKEKILCEELGIEEGSRLTFPVFLSFLGVIVFGFLTMFALAGLIFG